MAAVLLVSSVLLAFAVLGILWFASADSDGMDE